MKISSVTNTAFPRTAFALLVVVTLLSSGCTKQSTEDQLGGEAAYSPVVLCGSSFLAPVEELLAEYQQETGEEMVVMIGGSEDHLPKVKLQSTGDLYVSHHPFMQYTKDADAMLREVPVGFLSPVLVVKKGNPLNIKSIEDLGNEGVRVVLPNPDFSTCGEMVRDLLAQKEYKDAVMTNVGNNMQRSHGEIGNHIQLDARDAGIMWNGVASGYLDKLEIVPVPYEYDEEIGVSVMGLSYTEHPDQVQRFLDFVERRGPEVFAKHGYTK